MSDSWLDVSVAGRKERHVLADGLTRLGAAGCDILIPDAGADQLHVWSDPPTALLVGGATTPLLNGKAFEEVALSDGDSIQWGGAVLVFGRPAVIEELPHEADAAPADPRAATPAPAVAPMTAPMTGPLTAQVVPAESDAGRALARLEAGVLVELGLAERKVAKRWQDAVLRGEFDADACARDVLASSPVRASDPRVLERAGRLERDLLMIPLQRGVKGAGRRARQAGRRGAAYLVANLIAISVYSLLIAVLLIVARAKWEISVDGVIDSILETVSFSSST